MGTYICVHSTNSQVYLKMTKRAFLRYNYVPFSLQECLFHTTKEELNKIIWKKSVRFDTDAWYIITVCGVSTVNADTPDSNNVPGKANALVPLLCSVPFLSCEKGITVSLRARNHASVCPPWPSSSRLESYTDNKHPYRLLRGQRVKISIREGFATN